MSGIELHCDLEVAGERERQLLEVYQSTFQPAIRKQDGFRDVRLLKLRTAVAGEAPARCTYRLVISFDSEEQRQTWVASDLHQEVWPPMEANLSGSKYILLLYDASGDTRF